MWRKGNPCTLLMAMWKIAWRFLQKLKKEQPYDPGIPLLYIHARKIKSIKRQPHAHVYCRQEVETT